MRILDLHGWDLSVAEARAVQDEIAGRVDISPPLRLNDGDLVLGVDNSYTRTAAETTAFAAAIVMMWPDFEIVEVQTAMKDITFPYVPGLLTFRELPVLVEALRKVERQPALIFSDGHGIAHPRGIGIAAHLGVLAATPTIGIAKKPFRNTWDAPGSAAGDHSPLYRQDGAHVGYAIRTSARRKHPVFASPGNLIRVEDVLQPVVVASGGSFLPRPQQAAHDEVTRLRAAFKAAHDDA